MLDTGHLMNCNTGLRTQEEAVQYIFRILKMQEDILPYIRGVHLNASLSGECVEEIRGKEPVLAETYWDRWCQVFAHVFRWISIRHFMIRVCWIWFSTLHRST